MTTIAKKYIYINPVSYTAYIVIDVSYLKNYLFDIKKFRLLYQLRKIRFYYCKIEISRNI